MDGSAARVAPLTGDALDVTAAPADERVAKVLQLRRAVAAAGHPTASPAATPLPLAPEVEHLVADGVLRRGTIVEVSGSPLLAISMAAGPLRSGGWAACVGVPALGWSAAAAGGWELSRVISVAPPVRRWASVVGALVDAVDVVLLGPDPSPTAAEARRLHARARERGTVLILVGDHADRSAGGVGAGVRGGWSDLADIRLQVTAVEWTGIGRGWGHLAAGKLVVECSGRRGGARPRRAEVALPGGCT
ncbi:MAG: hypothetical protein ACKOYM_09225 [Actinomycetes bacterium]